MRSHECQILVNNKIKNTKTSEKMRQYSKGVRKEKENIVKIY